MLAGIAGMGLLAVLLMGFFAAYAVASGQVGQRANGAKAQAWALYMCA